MGWCGGVVSVCAVACGMGGGVGYYYPLPRIKVIFLYLATCSAGEIVGRQIAEI
jgi:hypothetical protein